MLQSLDTLIAFVLIMTVTSLLVTILVQMFSAVLSLRGKNLANALALTFQTVAPSLGGQAHALAARILSDPLLSDSTRTLKNKDPATAAVGRTTPWHFANPMGAMRLATAIRPEEVYAAIRHLANGSDALQNAADTVLKAVSQVDPGQAFRSTADPLFKLAEKIVDPAAKQQFQAEFDKVGALWDAEMAARTRLETWFKSAQDRAQQWFQLHTRGLSIGASVLVALVLQLDAVEIFHYVSTNAAARAALVAGADKVIQQGDGMLDEKGGLVQRIAEAWNAGTNHAGLKLENLAGVVHTGQLEDALLRRYAEKPDPSFKNSDELRQAYEQVVAAATRSYYQDRSQELADLTQEVSATGFELMPQGFWRWPAPPGPHSGSESLRNVGRHSFGILLFAALLTLGAPYWYNVLKNFSSLRPALAQLIGKEETKKKE